MYVSLNNALLISIGDFKNIEKTYRPQTLKHYVE